MRRSLPEAPAALDIRWAKWSVLTRSGQGTESIAELGRIAKIDVRNPLVHLRLAQELRKLDRLEESLESYKKAVDLAPGFPQLAISVGPGDDSTSWIIKARTDDVQYVLHNAVSRFSARTPCQESARTNRMETPSIEAGASTQFMTKDMTGAQRKEWASIRAEAWNLFSMGRYRGSRADLSTNAGSSIPMML